MDKKKLLKTIKKNEHILEKEELKEFTKDREFMLEAVKLNGNSLRYASKELKNDKEMVMEAIKNNNLSFAHASERLQNDKDVVFEAIKGVKGLEEILKKSSLDFSFKLEERKKSFNERMSEELEKSRRTVIKILAKVLITLSQAMDGVLKEAQKINDMENDYEKFGKIHKDVKSQSEIYQSKMENEQSNENPKESIHQSEEIEKEFLNEKNEETKDKIDEIFDEVLENPEAVDKYVEENIVEPTKFKSEMDYFEQMYSDFEKSQDENER